MAVVLEERALELPLPRERRRHTLTPLSMGMNRVGASSAMRTHRKSLSSLSQNSPSMRRQRQRGHSNTRHKYSTMQKERDDTIAEPSEPLPRNEGGGLGLGRGPGVSPGPGGGAGRRGSRYSGGGFTLAYPKMNVMSLQHVGKKGAESPNGLPSPFHYETVSSAGVALSERPPVSPHEVQNVVHELRDSLMFRNLQESGKMQLACDIAARMRYMEVQDDAYLIREGDDNAECAVFVIASGQATISVQKGQDEVDIKDIRAPDYFGEGRTLTNGRAYASVRARHHLRVYYLMQKDVGLLPEETKAIMLRDNRIRKFQNDHAEEMFEKIRDDVGGMMFLTKFAKEQHLDVDVKFYSDVMAYRSLDNDRDRVKHAKKIFENYLSPHNGHEPLIYADRSQIHELEQLIESELNKLQSSRGGSAGAKNASAGGGLGLRFQGPRRGSTGSNTVLMHRLGLNLGNGGGNTNGGVTQAPEGASEGSVVMEGGGEPGRQRPGHVQHSSTDARLLGSSITLAALAGGTIAGREEKERRLLQFKTWREGSSSKILDSRRGSRLLSMITPDSRRKENMSSSCLHELRGHTMSGNSRNTSSHGIGGSTGDATTGGISGCGETHMQEPGVGGGDERGGRGLRIELPSNTSSSNGFPSSSKDAENEEVSNPRVSERSGNISPPVSDKRAIFAGRGVSPAPGGVGYGSYLLVAEGGGAQSGGAARGGDVNRPGEEEGAGQHVMVAGGLGRDGFAEDGTADSGHDPKVFFGARGGIERSSDLKTLFDDVLAQNVIPTITQVIMPKFITSKHGERYLKRRFPVQKTAVTKSPVAVFSPGGAAGATTSLQAAAAAAAAVADSSHLSHSNYQRRALPNREKRQMSLSAADLLGGGPTVQPKVFGLRERAAVTAANANSYPVSSAENASTGLSEVGHRLVQEGGGGGGGKDEVPATSVSLQAGHANYGFGKRPLLSHLSLGHHHHQQQHNGSGGNSLEYRGEAAFTDISDDGGVGCATPMSSTMMSGEPSPMSPMESSDGGDLGDGNGGGGGGGYGDVDRWRLSDQIHMNHHRVNVRNDVSAEGNRKRLYSQSAVAMSENAARGRGTHENDHPEAVSSPWVVGGTRGGQSGNGPGAKSKRGSLPDPLSMIDEEERRSQRKLMQRNGSVNGSVTDTNQQHGGGGSPQRPAEEGDDNDVGLFTVVKVPVRSSTLDRLKNRRRSTLSHLLRNYSSLSLQPPQRTGSVTCVIS